VKRQDRHDTLQARFKRAKRLSRLVKERQQEYRQDPTDWRQDLLLIDCRNLAEAVADLVELGGDEPTSPATDGRGP
jgi:hypothetical protein